jgi:hypothetical protein
VARVEETCTGLGSVEPKVRDVTDPQTPHLCAVQDEVVARRHNFPVEVFRTINSQIDEMWVGPRRHAKYVRARVGQLAVRLAGLRDNILDETLYGQRHQWSERAKNEIVTRLAWRLVDLGSICRSIDEDDDQGFELYLKAVEWAKDSYDPHAEQCAYLGDVEGAADRQANAKAEAVAVQADDHKPDPEDYEKRLVDTLAKDDDGAASAATVAGSAVE